MKDRENQHPEDLPWNDSSADSNAPVGSHDPAPADVLDGADRSGANFPSDPYHRDSLEERLAEEAPERGGREGDGETVSLADEGSRDDRADIGEPDDEDSPQSPAQPAEEAAIHLVEDDR